jgi:hypothetical protein
MKSTAVLQRMRNQCLESPAVLVDDVVLARNPVNRNALLAEHLVGIVELGGLGEMRDVAGMNDEGHDDQDPKANCHGRHRQPATPHGSRTGSRRWQGFPLHQGRR